MNKSCQLCAHFKTCKVPCVFVENIINGNVKRKEQLMKYEPDKLMAQPYNDVLHRLIRFKQEDHAEEIRQIDNLTIRAITALLYADISILQIAGIMGRSKQTIYNYLERWIQEREKGL